MEPKWLHKYVSMYFIVYTCLICNYRGKDFQVLQMYISRTLNDLDYFSGPSRTSRTCGNPGKKNVKSANMQTWHTYRIRRARGDMRS